MGNVLLEYLIFSYQICKEPDYLTGVFEYWSEILEPDGFGSRFPYMFEKFYSGEVSLKDLDDFQAELETITEMLRKIPVNVAEILMRPLFISCIEKEPSQKKLFNLAAKNALDVFNSYLDHNLIEEIKDAAKSAKKFNSSLKIVYSPI